MGIRQKFREKIVSKTRNPQKTEINSKTIKWISILFPYGLFLMWKKKAFTLPIRIFISVFTVLVVIGVADKILQPYALLDSQVNNAVKAYVSEHQDEMGQYKLLDKIKYDSNSTEEYQLFTSKDKYLVFVKISPSKKESLLLGIYEVGHKQKVIFQDKSFKMPKNILPQVYFYIIRNKKLYGDIISVEKTQSPYQFVKTSTGEYSFMNDFGRIDLVFKKNKSTKKWDNVFEISNNQILLPSFKKILDDGKYGKLQIIIKYELLPTGQVEYLKTTTGYYKFIEEFNGTVKVYSNK